MELIATLATLWLMLFGGAVILQRGDKFAAWSWKQFQRPFVWAWGKWHTQILCFLAGILVGVACAPQIHQFLR
jgi:hypothetical protein